MLSLQDHIKDFLADKKRENLSSNSLKYYRNGLAKFAAFMAQHADKPLIEDITTQHIRAYIDDMAADDNLAEGGICARLRAIRTFFNWLMDDDILAVSPMRRIKLPKVPYEQQAIVRYSQYRKLVEVTKTSAKPLRDCAIIMTLYDSGLRASELLGLHVSDIMQGGLLHVRQGKGGKDRLVPVSRAVVKALHRYMRQERRETPVEDLFLGHGEEPLTRHGLRFLIYRLCETARIERLSPHAFRRGFVVAYMKNQGDMFSAKRILGHASLTMVDRYAAMGIEDLKDIHRRASPV